MSGFLMRTYGDVISEARTGEDGAIWYRLAVKPMARLKDATHAYLRDHNRTFGTGYTVRYPKPYRMVLAARGRARR